MRLLFIRLSRAISSRTPVLAGRSQPTVDAASATTTELREKPSCQHARMAGGNASLHMSVFGSALLHDKTAGRGSIMAMSCNTISWHARRKGGSRMFL
eukprot:359267-Chlamydomonas_euryale.AAC.3